MNKTNKTAIFVALIIGLSAIISTWLYRDVELKKVSLQISKQQKIGECIQSVKQRYGQVANAGKGILNYNEIIVMKTQSNAEEDRCIARYK